MPCIEVLALIELHVFEVYIWLCRQIEKTGRGNGDALAHKRKVVIEKAFSVTGICTIYKTILLKEVFYAGIS